MIKIIYQVFYLITWSLTLGEEFTIQYLETKSSGKFGTERDEVNKEWRIMYNEKFLDLYKPNSFIRIMKSGRRDSVA
jgi:hypothetical protein